MDNNETIQKLISEAKKALKYSYSPYSKFPVGASVLTKNKKIYSGCNIENSSYSLTICAERNAIFKAISEGEKEIEYLAIFTDTEKATPPCGSCRQVLTEFGQNAKVLSVCSTDHVLSYKISELLPDSFTLKK